MYNVLFQKHARDINYIFIFNACHCSGETNVNIAYLSRYIHSLLSGSYADEKSEVSCLLERQYKVSYTDKKKCCGSSPSLCMYLKLSFCPS